ncbi:MAG: tetratricopeptide repeat protein [Gammaproteobacteria bacterium]|nr:tetratricopeptide repeat protein [Gammaproteobacteria bacterium]
MRQRQLLNRFVPLLTVTLVMLGMVAIDTTEAREATLKDLSFQRGELRRELRHEFDGESRVPIFNARQKAIDAYRDFLKVAPVDSLQRAEAFRRLADLELEDIEERMLDDESTDTSGFLRPIALYQEFLQQYPEHQSIDRVLYQISRAYEAMANTDDALLRLRQLVGSHADSPLATEAWFRVGEMEFVRQSYSQAQHAYEQVVLAKESSRFYDNGLYKLGWSRFKQMQYETALQSFYTFLTRNLQVDDGGNVKLDDLSPAEREMLEDTLRVTSISFSYLDDPDSDADTISEFFVDHGKPKWIDLLYVRLGELYLEQKRYSDAAKTFAAFVDQDPNHDRAPLLQARVIDTFAAGGFKEQVLIAKEDFVERYRFPGDFWAKRDPADHVEVREQVKTHNVELAKHYHAVVSATKKSSVTADTQVATDKAVRFYRYFLEGFPQDEESSSMNFLLAELLFDSQDFASAAVEYERTAYEYPAHEKAAEAGYASILAYQKHSQSFAPDDDSRLVFERNSIVAALRFSDQYPEHPEAVRVTTNAAEQLYRFSDFTDAIAAAERVLERKAPLTAANNNQQRTAWTVIGHSHFEQKTYDKAEKAYRQAFALPVEKTPETGKSQRALAERLAASVYKQGEQMHLEGNQRGAVKKFLSVAALPGPTKIHPVAEYDAAATLIKLDDWGEAAPVLERFRQRYPNHKLSADVPELLATAYIKSGDKSKAASEYERIGATSTNLDKRREALWTAAELYESQNDTNAMVRTYQNVIDQFPEPINEAMEARQKMADVFDERGDLAQRDQWLRQIIAADNAAGAKRTDRSRYLAAQATLIFAEPTIASFEKVKIKQPLVDSVRVKKERLEDLLSAHGEAADYGVPEITSASTYKIAEAYQHFGESLMESSRPKGLDVAALEEYEILLEEQAFPFEEKSIEVHEVNTGRTAEGVYNEWVAKSFSSLAKIMPARYNKIEKSEPYVSSIQ